MPYKKIARDSGAPTVSFVSWVAAEQGDAYPDAPPFGGPLVDEMILASWSTITAPPVFDPATLSLTGWWRASYGGSPWVGVASAGSSGSRDLTEATNPPSAGSAVNGLTPADFDGSNDKLTGEALSNFIAAGSYFAWCLFRFDAATGGLGTFNSPNLIADVGGFWGVAVYEDGESQAHVGPWHWDGSAKTVDDEIELGEWTLVCWRFTGSDIRMRVNSRAIRTSIVDGNGAAGNVSSLSSNIQLGKGFANAFLDGAIADVGVMASAGSDDDFDNIKAYINARYGLSL